MVGSGGHDDERGVSLLTFQEKDDENPFLKIFETKPPITLILKKKNRTVFIIPDVIIQGITSDFFVTLMIISKVEKQMNLSMIYGTSAR